MNKTDTKVQQYIERADKILRMELGNTLRLTTSSENYDLMIIEIARLVQAEEHFNKTLDTKE